jgi:hypothetical protein
MAGASLRGGGVRVRAGDLDHCIVASRATTASGAVSPYEIPLPGFYS